MPGATGDPLDAEGPELRPWRAYGSAHRAIRRVTLDAVPATWPGLVRHPALALAALAAVLLTAAAWIPVTVVVAFNLLGRRSPSGR